MWGLRIVLSFLLVILMGKPIAKIVHNLTPFEAKSVHERNAWGKFVRSKMIDFFEYEITYEYKVAIEHQTSPNELFGALDNATQTFQLYLDSERKIHPHSFFYHSHNATIATVSVPPLMTKGNFMIQRGINNFTATADSFGFIIPGAEPQFNPLLAAVGVLYVLTVIIGFTVEIISNDKHTSAYQQMVEDDEQLIPRKRKNILRMFLNWAIVVALVEIAIILLAMKAGDVPSKFS